jgi:hypothetical protein
MMPLWGWTLMGATSVLAVSALVGLVAGAILGSISRDVTELLEMEPRSSAPLRREKTAAPRA